MEVQMIKPKMNLREHLLQEGVETELRRLIYHIAGSSKYIAAVMGQYDRKLADSQNLSGEEQLELDVLANQILLERLRRDTSFGIREFASEEEDRIVQLDTNGGKYSIAVDPIDGSSLANVNLSIGAIVAIYDGPILQGKPGRENMVAAMYIVFGPLTTLVFSAGKGTHEFVLDHTGNYVLATLNIRMNEKGGIYSPGGLKKHWPVNHANFIDDLQEQGYKLRYSGGLVADINQILLKSGGVFTYPALHNMPDGKLRLLFELQPMAFLIEHAGGLATDGEMNILDIIPKDLNQRSPIYAGSSYEVELARKHLKNCTKIS